MIAWMRTAVFYAGWALLTLALGMGGLPCLLSQRATWRLARVWVALSLAWLRLACGIYSHVRGREYMPPRGGIIAARHQSTWDTLMLWHLLGNPAFVLKRELYRIPIFGWYLWRAGQIAIDRRAGRDAVRHMLTAAHRLAAHGRTLVIFPEGTRTRPDAPRPFHAGVARISTALQLPVTPVALNAGCFWPKHSLKKIAGDAVVEFLPCQPMCHAPIAPWLNQLQMLIHSHSARLAATAVQLPVAQV